MADRAAPPTLGTVMKSIRSRNGWTLKEMSAKSGIPVSTLSKVEHDRLTLSYDKLQQLSQRLNIRMSDLFAEEEGDSAPRVTGRRSIGTIDQAVRVTTDNYDYHYLCTDLRQKRMIPIITRIRAHSATRIRRSCPPSGRGIHLRPRRRDRNSHRILRPGYAQDRPGHLSQFVDGPRLCRRRRVRRSAGARRLLERR